jgi:hypothetical protein
MAVRAAIWALAAAMMLPVAVARGASERQSHDIYDFMVMNVCVDGHDRPLAGVAPTDPGCLRQRNIRVGEPIPYHLHNFPGRNRGCASRLGDVSKDNIPIRKDDETRIVSFYDHGIDPTCPDVAPGSPHFGRYDPGREGASIQWVDHDFGFIMGSWSPVAPSSWLTPSCRDGSSSSTRFFRGWVIGPRTVPPMNQPGFGVFGSAIVHLTGPIGSLPCPRRFHRYFTDWMSGMMRFSGGMTLETLVSEHYPRAAADGTSPGLSQQVERTYWTDAFGLTRWEKWARAGWIHPRSHRSAADLAAALFRAKRCDAPMGLPSFKTAAPHGQERYQATVGGGARAQVWYMTECHDFTNIVRDPTGLSPDVWGAVVSPQYWAR